MKQNNFPDICEFELRMKNKSDRSVEFDCLADFRVRAEEITLGDEECEVFFVKATISLQLEGFDPIPGSRFGEPKKVNVVERTEECRAATSNSRDVTIEGGVKLGWSGLSANGGMNYNMTKSDSQGSSSQLNFSSNHYRVKAIPNLKWEITEHDGSMLNETYLESDQLISLTERSKANRRMVSVDVSVKQRDLRIEMVRKGVTAGVLGKINNTQRKLLDIFIAKSINSKIPGAGQYQGGIKLSQFIFDSTGGDFDE